MDDSSSVASRGRGPHVHDWNTHSVWSNRQISDFPRGRPLFQLLRGVTCRARSDSYTRAILSQSRLVYDTVADPRQLRGPIADATRIGVANLLSD